MPITYFHGNRVNIPLVQLRSRTNGKTFWILNTHNPADVHGNAGKWRAESVRRELKRIQPSAIQGAHGAVHRRHERQAGVLLQGDPLRRAALGLRRVDRQAMPLPEQERHRLDPRDPRRRGSRKWRADTSTRKRGVSDHPIVVARATLRR